MKILVTSDIHLHPWKAFGGGTGRDNLRLQATLKVIRQVLEKARELDKVWIDGGDIIHSTGMVRHGVASSLIELLNEFPDVRKFLIFGNHDSKSKGNATVLEDSFQYTLKEAVENVFVLDKTIETVDGITIYGCGAQPNRDDLVFKKADIGIFHDFVRGAKLPSGITLSEGIPQEKLYENYRLSIVGDIHMPHLQEKDGRYILIPGSPEQHNFGDKGDRGFYVVSIDDKTIEIESIVTDSPKFITVDNPEKIKDDGNFYRLIGNFDASLLPDNAKYLAGAPDVVEARNVLSIGDGIDTILAKWLEINPPEGKEEKYLSVGKSLVAEQDIVTPQNHKLVKVEGGNFCSFEEFEYDIQKGTTLVVGSSDKFTSNGSGKSSLIGESIYWCLTGNTTKGQSANEVIRRGEKKCHVQLTIAMDNGSTLVILRERTPSLKLSATIDGNEVSADGNKDLEVKLLGILGINDKIIRALLYFSQEDLVLLSRATDAEIKDLSSDLAGLNGFQEAASVAGKKVSALTTSIDKTKDNLARIQSTLDAKKAQAKDIELNISKWDEELNNKIDHLVSKQTIVQHEFTSYENRSTDGIADKAERLLERADASADKLLNVTFVTVYNHKKKEYSTKLSAKEKELANFGEIESDLEALTKELEVKKNSIGKLETKLTEVREKRANVVSNGSTISYDLKRLNKTIPELEKGVCPTCGQKDPKAEASLEEAQGKIKELETKQISVNETINKADDYIKKLTGKMKEIKEEVADIQKNVDKVKEYNALEKEVEVLRQTVENSSRKEATLIAEQKRDNYLERRKQTIRNRLSQGRKFLTSKTESLERSLQQLHSAITTEKGRENPHIEYLGKVEKEVEDLEVKLTALTKALKTFSSEKEIYAYWNKGFGKSGVQSLLMDEIAGAFNDVRGQIFPVLTNGHYDVQFSTLSQIGSGELREKLDFLVFDNGEQVPYASLSGGQRRRVDLGVLLTMTAAICKSYNIDGILGIMILDEVASFLDESGDEAVAEVLEAYTNFAVPSVYIIDHSQSLQSLFSQIVEVEHRNGVSRVK